MDDNSKTRYNIFAYMSLAEEVSQTMINNIREKVENGATLNQVLDKTLILDSSPWNFHNHLFPKITSFIPNAKAILIMRDPVDRLFSNFRFSAQLKRRKDDKLFTDQTPEGFHHYITQLLDPFSNLTDHSLKSTLYHEIVSDLLDNIQRENIAFIKFEEFIKDPVGVIELHILPILGLQPYSENRKIDAAENARTNPSKSVFKMLPETRKFIQNYFSKFNYELSMLLNDEKWTWGY